MMLMVQAQLITESFQPNFLEKIHSQDQELQPKSPLMSLLTVYAKS